MAQYEVQLEGEGGWVTIGKTGSPVTLPEITYDIPDGVAPGDMITVNVSYPCRIGTQDDWDRVRSLGAYAPQPEEDHEHNDTSDG
jgi:hypothetical protein